MIEKEDVANLASVEAMAYARTSDSCQKYRMGGPRPTTNRNVRHFVIAYMFCDDDLQ